MIIFATKLNRDRQMKNSIGIIIISILVLSGCNKQSMSDSLLNEVEKVIAVNPDSASNLLKSISSPEKLDDKTFARWCMLSGKITDEIFNSILPTYQLERAYDWYSSHGSPDEQVQILIYLGRSFLQMEIMIKQCQYILMLWILQIRISSIISPDTSIAI